MFMSNVGFPHFRVRFALLFSLLHMNLKQADGLSSGQIGQQTGMTMPYAYISLHSVQKMHKSI
jgi:hypothetical protein